MGGDAIFHHQGNSTHVDYINKACWAWYDIRTWSATNDVFKVGACNYRRRCLSKKFSIMKQFWPFRVDRLILFLHCDKQRISSTIVERYFHLTMWHSVSYDLLEESNGITIESTFVLSIRLRIRFVLMSPRIDCDYLETWNSLSVVLLKRNLLSSNFGTCDFTFFFVCVSFSNWFPISFKFNFLFFLSNKFRCY